ncbi:hypothetical protein BH11MYX1_BH11MYX1_46550 [soil metagenome]
MLRLDIGLTAARRDELASLLDPAEQTRRERFHHLVDADRFLIGRATLRRELARVLAIDPRDVPLAAGPHGKPFVPGGPHANVSHAGDVVVIAISDDADVGIDVEFIDPRFVAEAMIEASFSSGERDTIAALPDALRVNAFFHTWTSREAVVKMIGAGFSLPKEAIDVSVDPRLPPRVERASPPFVCTLQTLVVPARHLAIVAVAAPGDAFMVTTS